MRNLVPILAAAAALATAGALDAQARTKTVITCPIGGATFEYAPGPAVVTRGERPDGKPYGLSGSTPLPECPGNGLVLYKDYSAAEVAKLEPLIASDAYRALLKGDTQYYRAYWLMKEMGLPPESYLWALLQASWEADGKPELRQRYLTELAEASGKVPPRPANLNWIGMEGRAINALRELGRFDEALARLARLPVENLETDANAGRRRWGTYLRQLRMLIERRDSSAEAFEMIPRTIALGRCIDAFATLAEGPRAFCQTEAAAVEAMRTKRRTLEEELQALGQSRERSGR